MNRIIMLLIISLNLLFAVDAKMEIVKRQTNMPKILVSVSTEATSSTIVKDVKDLIEKDLEVSGHFQTSTISDQHFFSENPDFNLLRKNSIDLYLNLYSEFSSLGNVIVSAKLYDINQKILVFSKSYSTSAKDRYPYLSHKLAIDTNDYLKAPSIDWMSKFVIFARYNSAKESEIVISDYTLTFQQVVVYGGLNIFPKWTDNNQESFYYTSYKNLVPTLMKHNIYTQKSEKISESDGMIVCSDVSNKDSNIVLTMAPNAQPDIYVYDVIKNMKSRITNYSGIDVGGSFVENNTKIVFVSDRLREPNIFAKTIGQNGVERLVYHGKNNSQCTTYENYVVYSSRETENEFSKNSFNLYLISTKSDFVRRLTSTGRNQFPKFSADGDSILFIKSYNNKSYLGIMRLNYNKSFLFPLKSGKLQSIDW